MQEEFQELKNKVAKQNLHSSKIDSFFIKQNKDEKSEATDETENVVDDDLIVEIENNKDDSDDESPLEDVEDSFTKVYAKLFNVYKAQCNMLSKLMLNIFF